MTSTVLHHNPTVLRHNNNPSHSLLHPKPFLKPTTPIRPRSFPPLKRSHSQNPISAFFTRAKTTSDYNDDKPREECGVVGIYGDPEASRLCYLCLHALQHRGQEGAGIVTLNDDGVLQSITGVGLVSDVFSQSKLDQLSGSSAIGHARYSTAGTSMLKNVQPFVASYKFGSVSVAHDGNLANYQKLRHMLEDNGSIFNTSSDTEVVLHLMAISKEQPFFLRIVEACQQLEGAYSMVFLTEDKLVAVRDPHGFRPLVMGRRSNGAVVFASETCALDLVEAAYEREIYPGEIIVVDKDGVQSSCLMSHLHAFGKILATEAPVECDVVIPVPDSGVAAALGYAEKAGVPFHLGLIRLSYVGRTFIEPSQKDSGVVATLGYAEKAGVPFHLGLSRSHYVGRTFIEPTQKIY